MHVKILHWANKAQYENHILVFYIVIKDLDRLHDQFVLVPGPAKKAGNSIVFVCRTHFINYILEELGFDSVKSYQLFSHSSVSKEKILQNQFWIFSISPTTKLIWINLPISLITLKIWITQIITILLIKLRLNLVLFYKSLTALLTVNETFMYTNCNQFYSFDLVPNNQTRIVWIPETLNYIKRFT